MSSSALTHPLYRADIDGLRAVAILTVVLFHAFPEVFPGGFIGVDIFFVISGFLISSIIFGNLEHGSFSYATFYARRIKRIFPALIVVLLSGFLLGWFTLLADEYKQFGKHLMAGVGFVSNLVLWSESGYFDAPAASKPLLHLWSLAIEEQFYLLWPILMGVVWQRRWHFLKVTLAIALVSFAVNVYSVGVAPVAAFYSPLSRFWELMVGGILAYWTLHQMPFRMLREPNWRAGLGLGLLVLGWVFLNKTRAFPGAWALLPTLGAFLLISAGSTAWVNQRILANRGMAWIGLISYPLYLWHWLLLSFAQIIEAGTPSIVTRLLAVLASVLLAWFTYLGLEKPIRTRRWGGGLIASLCGLMLVLALLGYNTYQRDGLGFRFNTLMSQFVSTDFDVHQSWRQDVCFLGDKGTTFGACTERRGKQLVFLWGDSHAAALYPGLQALQKHAPFGIAQYTAAGCPPLLTANQNQRCEQVNRTVLTHLQQEQPDIVLLHADWKSSSLTELHATLTAIRQVSAARIVLIGPAPHWTDVLPKLYWVYWRKHHQLLPERTHFGVDTQIQPLDEQARMLAQTEHLAYYSAYQRLCDAQGCLSSVNGQTRREITTFDGAHLTPSAAGYVLTDAATVIFPKP